MVGSDDRGVSETTGVAIMIGFTLLVTASVGISVLFISDDDGGANANFSFDFRSGNSMLLVTHERGDALPAGQVVFDDNSQVVSWAAIADRPPNASVETGDLVQLSSSSAWGSPVRQGQQIDVYYAPGDGNRTLLDSWSG